jgi:hypothetical protein
MRPVVARVTLANPTIYVRLDQFHGAALGVQVVIEEPAPVNTVAPAVTGTATIGSTITCSTGTWTNSPTGYAYQWQRAGTNISGATSQTYVLTSADSGYAVGCVVTASNAGGSASAASNTVVAPMNGSESDGTQLYPVTGNTSNATLAAASGITAPDGTQTGVQSLKETAATGRHNAFDNIHTLNDTKWTGSIYVQAGTLGRQYFYINIANTTPGDSAYAFMDFVNGVLTDHGVTGSSMTVLNAMVQPGANGWWKLTLSAQSTSAVYYCFFGLSLSATQAGSTLAANDCPSYAGSTANGCYVWRIKETSP